MPTMNTIAGATYTYGDNSFKNSTPYPAVNIDDYAVFVNLESAFSDGDGNPGIEFFGVTYSGLYINSNGLITFGSPVTAYVPDPISDLSTPAIAPFWSDVDVRGATDGDIYWHVDDATGTVTITWDDVASYQNLGAARNSFQVVISDNGDGSLSVEFIYDHIEWTDGYFGNGDATLGITDGEDPPNFVELPGSNTDDLLGLEGQDLGNGDPDGTWDADIDEFGITLSDGIVSGTGAGELIDASYEGDPENDLVDSLDGPNTDRNEDVIEAGGGADTVYAGDANDTVRGQGGNDSLFGEDGNDSILGGGGDDILYGDEGVDTLYGNGGDDTLNVSSGDQAYGNDGNDTFILTDLGEGDLGTINIFGGNVDDSLVGDTLDLSGVILTAYDRTGESGTGTLADGTQFTFSDIENIIICFTSGTMIETPSGPRPIDTLSKGDLVLTLDNGAQPIRWVGKRTVPAKGKLAPIKINKGTLGATSDLLVSPQHRMLLRGATAQLLFGTSEVLTAAKHLTNGDSVTRMTGGEVTYIHLMFDRHEIVFAQGAPSESFFPGETGLAAVEDAAREELFEIFPEIRALPKSYGPAARTCLKAHEAGLLRAS